MQVEPNIFVKISDTPQSEQLVDEIDEVFEAHDKAQCVFKLSVEAPDSCIRTLLIKLL